MRALIVEDEYSLTDVIETSLKKNNILCDVAYNGDDGYDYALSDIYDVIILDIMLPGMNGIQILEGIRNEGIVTPVIMLTAKSELDDKLNGLKTGADDYMTKPFHIEELIARIYAVTRRSSSLTDDNDLTVNDIKLDLRKCKLFCNDESIDISGKEIALLELLIRNKNQVISKEVILNKVWGLDNEIESNNIEVYLHFIRKKLKAINSKTNIRVLRGIGYKIEE